MTELPSGTVTLLFTDIEGSTRLWDEHPAAMGSALAAHNVVIREAIERHGGVVVKDKGDGFFAAFAHAADGVAAALAGQRGLRAAEWPEATGTLRVRMALHTGPVEVSDGDYHGPSVNRLARLEGLAHGGQTLLSEATRALAADALPEAVTLLDLGTHSLRGLERPERVFQLVAADIESSFPPLRSAAARRVPLPDFATSFVGRDGDVIDVSGLVRSNRLVTLLGPGGIGKTRLAVESARLVETELPGGAVFVDLAPVGLDGVPLAIAEAVGAHPEGTASIPSLVADRVAQPTLMVLDNFEHVIEASMLIAELMGAAGPLRLLATSRSPLHVRGEHVYRVSPLDAAGGNGTMAPAVALFYDRAESYGTVLERTGPERDAIEDMCRRVDGLPLAIELVAAKTRLLSIEDLAARLSSSLDAIASASVDVPERQRTIRATIDWSLDALTNDQRRLFETISAFPAGVTLNAIESVEGDGGDVLSDVAALVDASLINVVTGLPGGTRYRQLAPLREYGLERLHSRGAFDDTMGRIADYYIAAAPELARRLDEAPDAERELTVDHSNLLAAMQWSLESDRLSAMVAAIADLWVNWFNGDKAAMALDWVARADELVAGPRVDWLVGMFAFQAGDYERAAARMAAAADGFREAGDPSWLARALIFGGILDEDLEQGRQMLQTALDSFEDGFAGVDKYLAMIFMSSNAMQRGAVDETLALRRDVVAVARAADYPVLEAWGRWNLALALYATGDVDGAAAENLLTLRQMDADRYLEGIASSAGIAALVASHRGRAEDAIRILGGAEAIWQRLGIMAWPELTMHQDAVLADAGEALGEQRVGELLEEGRRLTVDQVVELAGG